MMKLDALRKNFQDAKDAKTAIILQRFFKTGSGEYAEGDKFIGIRVPKIRELVKPFYDLHHSEISKLLCSKIHEERFAALIILIQQYQNANNRKEKEQIYKLYINHFSKINNWDLVDVSAPKIPGDYLFNFLQQSEVKKTLAVWAKSKDLWTRRIAMITTFYFIRQDEFSQPLTVAKLLLKDKHDLIHKAVGWMLREVGKRNLAVEENFLAKYYKLMPRTMLRYAIERFQEEKRKAYLYGTA